MKAKVSVKQNYASMVDYEWKRVVHDPYHRLEHDTTWFFLDKHLPKHGLILDAGGGPGRYTIELAKKGYEVVLLDYTPENLELAKSKIKYFFVTKKVKEIVEGSIVDLSRYPDNSFDAVLCLGGPLSHVEGEANRAKAVKELLRVTKKDSPVFISVMGLINVLTLSPIYWPEEVDQTKHFQDMWQKGDDNLWRGSSYCHFFRTDELKELIEKSGGREIALAGLEGMALLKKQTNQLAKRHPTAYKNWLDCHYHMCLDPTVADLSGHILAIFTK